MTYKTGSKRQSYDHPSFGVLVPIPVRMAPYNSGSSHTSPTGAPSSSCTVPTQISTWKCNPLYLFHLNSILAMPYLIGISSVRSFQHEPKNMILRWLEIQCSYGPYVWASLKLLSMKRPPLILQGILTIPKDPSSIPRIGWPLLGKETIFFLQILSQVSANLKKTPLIYNTCKFIYTSLFLRGVKTGSWGHWPHHICIMPQKSDNLVNPIGKTWAMPFWSVWATLTKIAYVWDNYIMSHKGVLRL